MINKEISKLTISNCGCRFESEISNAIILCEDCSKLSCHKQSEVNMKPYQQRVVEERDQLFKRVNLLNDFIVDSPQFAKLDPKEQERMKIQNDIMWQYYEILEKRIKAFN